jgi:hypothetical protein
MGIGKQKLVTFFCLVSVVSLFATTLAGCGASRNIVRRTPDAGETALARVSEVRRALRAACGQLKSINADPGQAEALLPDATARTDHAAMLWAAFLGDSGETPPRPYASHPDWATATREIRDGIATMLKHCRSKDSALAFEACGRTCGKFVALNEAAGVRRTSDILFRFRKTAKPLLAQLESREVPAIAAGAAELVKLRDEAMTNPVGGIGTASQKEEALQAFSEAVDRFAEGVRASDREDAIALYNQMIKAMEVAYDLFL